MELLNSCEQTAMQVGDYSEDKEQGKIVPSPLLKVQPCLNAEQEEITLKFEQSFAGTILCFLISGKDLISYIPALFPSHIIYVDRFTVVTNSLVRRV